MRDAAAGERFAGFPVNQPATLSAGVEPALPVVRPYLRRTLSALAGGAMKYYNDKRAAFVVMVLVAIVVFLLLFAH